MNRPGDLNEIVESDTAENFIHWYNQKNGRNLTRSKKQEAPDFIYTDEDGEIGLEVTTAYYDQRHARATGEIGRKRRRPTTVQEVVNNPEGAEWISGSEASLTDFINRIIKNKCQKLYGENCILLIRVVRPDLTTVHELQHVVIPDLRVPEQNPFKEVYLTINQQCYFKLA